MGVGDVETVVGDDTDHSSAICAGGEIWEDGEEAGVAFLLWFISISQKSVKFHKHTGLGIDTPPKKKLTQLANADLNENNFSSSYK